MYHNNNSHSAPLGKNDLLKSVKKFKVVVVKKNRHFSSTVIDLKVIALSFVDFPLGIYLLHCMIFKYKLRPRCSANHIIFSLGNQNYYGEKILLQLFVNL